MSILLSRFSPISIIPVQFNFSERLVSSRLCAFMKTKRVFSRHQYVYCKGLETCDAMLDIVCAGQAALDRGRELAVE